MPPQKKIFRRKKKQKTKFFFTRRRKNLFCPEKHVYLHPQAPMVELVDTHVSGTCAARCAGSSPVRGTKTTPAFRTREFLFSRNPHPAMRTAPAPNTKTSATKRPFFSYQSIYWTFPRGERHGYCKKNIPL